MVTLGYSTAARREAGSSLGEVVKMMVFPSAMACWMTANGSLSIALK